MVTVSRPQEVLIIQTPDLVMTCDARTFPLLIITTDGLLDAPAYDEMFVWRTEWTDYAAAMGTKVIVLSSNATMKPPNSLVRKHIGEKVKDDAQIPGLLGACIVMPSALLRGMVTAMLWVAGSAVNNIKTYGTFAEALTAAEKGFSMAGISFTSFDPETYQLPDG